MPQAGFIDDPLHAVELIVGVKEVRQHLSGLYGRLGAGGRSQGDQHQKRSKAAQQAFRITKQVACRLHTFLLLPMHDGKRWGDSLSAEKTREVFAVATIAITSKFFVCSPPPRQVPHGWRTYG